MFLYFPYRKKKRKQLEREFDEELEQIAIRKANKENELARTNLQMHVSGHFLTKLFELQSVATAKLHAAKSFLSNLKAWYREESETIQLLDADTQLPFIPLLKNPVLDKYFEKHKKAITEDISLSAGIVSFSKHIENETIRKEDLKQYKESIKERCVKELEASIQGFNVYSFLCNPTVRYEFIDENPEFVEKILPKMDEKSNVFLCDNGTDTILPGKYILIHAPTDNNARQWERFYPKYFSEKPNSLLFLSPYKVMVIQLADFNVSQIF